MITTPVTRESAIQSLRKLAPDLRARGIVRVDLFGSVARNESSPSSDLDLIVELDRPMGLEFFEIENFLSDVLGVPVELSTRESMRPRVRVAAERDIVRIF